jgi:ParB family chromosome partitioning protein
MADKLRGLGRGLESLIPTPVAEPQPGVAGADGPANSGNMVVEIAGDLVDPNPYQPRKNFDREELEALAASIRVHGILQPLVVSKVGNRFQLVAGERRLRAAKIAGLDVVPVMVRSFDEQQKLELSIIENIQRAELNGIELGTAYRRLIDEFNMSVNDVAEKVGKDYSTISNTMRLLKLPQDARDALVSGKISDHQGRAILMLEEPEKQAYLLKMILKHHWSGPQAIDYARGYRGEMGSKMKAQARIAAVTQLTVDLGNYLGAKVTQKKTAKGGKLIIEYYSEEELERLYKFIKRED